MEGCLLRLRLVREVIELGGDAERKDEGGVSVERILSGKGGGGGRRDGWSSDSRRSAGLLERFFKKLKFMNPEDFFRRSGGELLEEVAWESCVEVDSAMLTVLRDSDVRLGREELEPAVGRRTLNDDLLWNPNLETECLGGGAGWGRRLSAKVSKRPWPSQYAPMEIDTAFVAFGRRKVQASLLLRSWGCIAVLASRGDRPVVRLRMV